MRATAVSKQALEQAALVEIRALHGCEDVVEVSIDLVRDSASNWRIGALRRTACAVHTASALALTDTIRAIEYAQKKLRNLYSLRTD
jgi:hypothetical protein